MQEVLQILRNLSRWEAPYRKGDLQGYCLLNKKHQYLDKIKEYSNESSYEKLEPVSVSADTIIPSYDENKDISVDETFYEDKRHNVSPSTSLNEQDLLEEEIDNIEIEDLKYQEIINQGIEVSFEIKVDYDSVLKNNDKEFEDDEVEVISIDALEDDVFDDITLEIEEVNEDLEEIKEKITDSYEL